MSHVDEGALHAYLDGVLDEYPPADAERIREHLDRCASCAERLEIERRVRSDAQAMLALAAPDVAAPSFEELRAYVERTRVRPAASRRLSRLGWAASVVLAVGAGWMLRDGQLEQTRLMDRSLPTAGSGAAPLAEAVVTRSSEAVDEVAKSGTESTVDVITPSAELPENPVAPRADSPESRVAARARSDTAGAAAEADVAAPEDVVVAAAPPQAGSPAVGGESSDEKMLDARTMRIRAALPPATEALDPSSNRVADVGSTTSSDHSTDPLEAIVPGTDLADVATSDAFDVGTRAGATTDAGAPPEAEVGGPTEDDTAAEAPAEVDARDDAGAPVVVTSAQAVSPGASLRDTEEAGRDVLAEPRLAVPGLEVLEVTNLVAGRSYLGGRVLQRQDDGSIIEVLNLEPGVGLSVLPPLAVGHREARAEVASGWVVVRGALDQETLSGLLEQLLPEGR